MNTILTLGTSAIRQLDGLYSLNDLHSASGGDKAQQPANFMRLDNTQALIAEIGNSSDVRSFQTTTGRNGGTYVCRELVYAYAMWISAKFSLTVIRAFDALHGQPALPQIITPAQQNALQQIVAKRAGESGGIRAYMWSRFNNHFALGSYKQLPATRFDEAVAYLEAMPMKGEAPALAAPDPTAQAAGDATLGAVLGRHRYLTVQTSQGTIIMTRIDDDEWLGTPAKLIQDVGDPGSFFPRNLLPTLIQAAAKRLES
jgi:hypothetical protein